MRRTTLLSLLLLALMLPVSAMAAGIDINSAGKAQLETLPGVGPVKAERIVAHREANGDFTSVDQLTEVSGIGPATLEKLQDLVSVTKEGE